jgi:hypothetical protein
MIVKYHHHHHQDKIGLRSRSLIRGGSALGVIPRESNSSFWLTATIEEASNLGMGFSGPRPVALEVIKFAFNLVKLAFKMAMSELIPLCLLLSIEASFERLSFGEECL